MLVFIQITGCRKQIFGQALLDQLTIFGVIGEMSECARVLLGQACQQIGILCLGKILAGIIIGLHISNRT